MTALIPFPGTLPLPIYHELYIDIFAGYGGASDGGRRRYREPDIAINHNPTAIAVHRANHPTTKHYICDVFEVDPLEATGGQPVGILWASPDCRHHSKAKGGKPRNRRIRALAWVVVRWVYATRPRLLFLENVEEFQDWGPLDADDKPIKAERGRTFRAFVACLTTGLAEDHPDMPEILQEIGQWVPKAALVRGLGVDLEWQVRIAANRGTRQIRKRLYMVGRTDGRAIVWPQPTHHQKPTGNQKGWRPAAECIDFSNLGRSLIGRPKPPAHNTCVRVAKGIWRHVITAEKPFVVPLDETTLAPCLTEFANASVQRTFSAEEPLRTQVAQVKGGHFAMAAAHLTHLTHHGDRPGYSPGDPAKTVTGANRGEQALVAATLVGAGGPSYSGKPQAVTQPMGTVMTSNHRALSAAFFEQANGGYYKGDGRSATAPLSTICTAGSNQRLVNAYLVKYYKSGGQWQALDQPMHTLPTKDRMGLVTVEQVPADILPPELLDKARACATFMHQYLPERFPEPAELLLIGDYVLVDITLRMLQPIELARAMGFRDDYIIDRGLFEDPQTGALEWRRITKTDQVKGIGNAVCPDEAEALIGENAKDMIEQYRRLAA